MFQRISHRFPYMNLQQEKPKNRLITRASRDMLKQTVPDPQAFPQARRFDFNNIELVKTNY